MPAPLILVSCDRRDPGPASVPTERERPPRAEVFLKEALVAQVRHAGGTPLLLPPAAMDSADLDAVLDAVQAVIVSGGAFDIHPSHYGQAVAARLDRVDDDRTDVELALCRAAMARDLPLLGICGGMQAMAVAAGGSLVQDIATALDAPLDHEQPTDPALPFHPVDLSPGLLRDLLGPRTQVNSTHHQAIAHPGSLVVTGRAPDGVAEALESPAHRFAVGVQWHPELLGDRRLFAALVAHARPDRAAR